MLKCSLRPETFSLQSGLVEVLQASGGDKFTIPGLEEHACFRQEAQAEHNQINGASTRTLHILYDYARSQQTCVYNVMPAGFNL